MSIDFQFLASLIAAVFVGGSGGYLGSLMISKRMALVGDALGHVALPGMGLALLLGMDVSFGAFTFLFLCILLVWFFGLRVSLPTEALVGIVFVSSLALGFLIVPQPELLEALFGDISRVSMLGALISAVLSIFIFLAISKLYSKMVLAGISEDLAKVQGINISKNNLFFLLLVTIIVALGVKLTGSLLVGALMIIPAAISKNLSVSLRQYCRFSAGFGILSSLAGIFLFKLSGLAAGPLIILSGVFFFLISVIFKRN